MILLRGRWLWDNIHLKAGLASALSLWTGRVSNGTLVLGSWRITSRNLGSRPLRLRRPGGFPLPLAWCWDLKKEISIHHGGSPTLNQSQGVPPAPRHPGSQRPDGQFSCAPQTQAACVSLTQPLAFWRESCLFPTAKAPQSFQSVYVPALGSAQLAGTWSSSNLLDPGFEAEVPVGEKMCWICSCGSGRRSCLGCSC